MSGFVPAPAYKPEDLAERGRGLPARPSSRDDVHGVSLTAEQQESYRAGFASGSEP